MPPSPERDLLEAEAQFYGRQLADPLRTWQPTRQRPFIKAVPAGTSPTVLFAAGNRSGKSSAAAYCGAALARFGKEPGAGCLLLGRGSERVGPGGVGARRECLLSELPGMWASPSTSTTAWRRAAP
jgi:hypothetical protein